ncbi:MAG TPA: hypothetical protein VFX45_02550 [Solirubrobacterales bacterium]|nr:hypothetical protein [Solirubrobacterales bacterium]
MTIQATAWAWDQAEPKKLEPLELLVLLALADESSGVAPPPGLDSVSERVRIGRPGLDQLVENLRIVGLLDEQNRVVIAR